MNWKENVKRLPQEGVRYKKTSSWGIIVHSVNGNTLRGGLACDCAVRCMARKGTVTTLAAIHTHARFHKVFNVCRCGREQ